MCRATLYVTLTLGQGQIKLHAFHPKPLDIVVSNFAGA